MELNLSHIHNAGFFSCCSIRLYHIINCININKKLPINVNCTEMFKWYKIQNYSNDITFEYFEHYNNVDHIEYNKDIHIDYHWDHQFIDYSTLEFMNIIPIIKKYFYPSSTIIHTITNFEQKYKLEYENICVLFYRGNDKIRETTLCDYNEYITYANLIIHKNPTIQFLIQSDETEFINVMTAAFPNNSFYFKDEIRHINKCNSTVDVVMQHQNHIFSKYYLAITIIMSKCKYIICGSGNCSIWIVLYRGNTENVYQNLNNKWIINDSIQSNSLKS